MIIYVENHEGTTYHYTFEEYWYKLTIFYYSALYVCSASQSSLYLLHFHNPMIFNHQQFNLQLMVHFLKVNHHWLLTFCSNSDSNNKDPLVEIRCSTKVPQVPTLSANSVISFHSFKKLEGSLLRYCRSADASNSLRWTQSLVDSWI